MAGGSDAAERGSNWLAETVGVPIVSLAVAVPTGTATLSANSAPTSPRHAHPGSPSPGGLLSPLALSRLIATVDQDHPPGRPVDVGSVALGDPVWLEPQEVVHGQERIPGLGCNSPAPARRPDGSWRG